MGMSLLDAAREVARIAGEASHGYYRSSLTVEAKQDGSPVTKADRDAEQAARAWITARFPDDAILGEEFGATDGASGASSHTVASISRIRSGIACKMS